MSKKPEQRESRGVEVEAVERDNPRIPSWFGEAVLLGKYWWDSGLVGYLEEEVRVLRGRMGQYEVQDFVLLLNSYAISGEKSLSDFFKALNPVKEVLMSLWERKSCPSASSLSRFLAAMGSSGVEALRVLFEQDLGRNSVRVKSEIGMFDRSQGQWVLFDVDGTVCAVRERLIQGDVQNDPAGIRRSQGSCAPGYKGRKRGEVIRNRTTVSQAQTSEWLGTYGSAGNGAAQRELERSCGVIVGYLKAQWLQAGHGIVRLDGLYQSGETSKRAGVRTVFNLTVTGEFERQRRVKPVSRARGL